MLLEISFDATYTEQFEALQPLFERMLKRIKVTPVAELDVSQIARSYKSPEVKISQRQDLRTPEQ